MPASDNSLPKGTTLAIVAETLYLLNLMIIPGVAFLILLGLYFKHRNQAPAIASSHLAQTVSASIWAGLLLILANLVIILMGGYDGPYTWVVVILYFTIAHSTLILIGVLGLSKALAGLCWRYPLIGRPLPEDCP